VGDAVLNGKNVFALGVDPVAPQNIAGRDI
jgi:hypothetical protein